MRQLIARHDLVYAEFHWSVPDLVTGFGRTRVTETPLVLGEGSDIAVLDASPRWYRKNMERAMRSVSLVLCGSRFVEARVRKRFPEIRTAVHYLGIVDVPKEMPARPEHADEFRVVAASRLHPIKGVDSAIRSFLQAFGGDPRCTLTIVGDGPLRSDLETLRRSLDNAGQIRMLGELPSAKLLRSFKAPTSSFSTTSNPRREPTRHSVVPWSKHRRSGCRS